MTLEDTETLILAFTWKTGQSAAHNRQRISFDFDFSVRERIYSFCRLNFRLKILRVLEIDKQRGTFAFYIDF